MNLTDLFPVVAPILVICYLVGLLLKNIPAIKDELIPCIVGLVGGILGVVGMYIIIDYPAKDIMTAIAVGIVSGLASTGTHQLYKQLKSLIGGDSND
jgi:ribonucleotide monophosphatase NagD (HAD superfamily)